MMVTLTCIQTQTILVSKLNLGLVTGLQHDAKTKLTKSELYIKNTDVKFDE